MYKLVVASTIVAVSAFAPQQGARRPTVLRMTPYEIAEKKATEATEKYGAQSPEARLAWEMVTELNDAASAAKIAKPSLDQACDADEDECATFSEKMDEFTKLVANPDAVPDYAKNNAVDTAYSSAPIEVKVKATEESDLLKAATMLAEAATTEFGPTSKQAKSAWETVEELNQADALKRRRGL